MKNFEDYELEFRQAAAKGDLARIRLLISKIGEIDSIGLGSGKSALHRATEGKYSEIIVFLLQEGANSLLKDKNGKTPLNLYMESAPGRVIISMTTRHLQKKAANILDALSIDMCKKFAQRGETKPFLLITQFGDIKFADDPIKITSSAIPYQEKLHSKNSF